MRQPTVARQRRSGGAQLAMLLVAALGLLAPLPVRGDVEELVQAAKDGDLAAVASLAAGGADLDEQHPTEGVTALYIASLRGEAAASFFRESLPPLVGAADNGVDFDDVDS